MKTRYGAVLVSVVLAFAAAGCTSSVISDAPPSTDNPVATPTAPPSTDQATPTDTASATTASDGCPVTAAVLTAAFNNDALLSKNLVLGNGLSNVVCYQGFAVAKTTPDPNTVDPATVLFAYDAPKASWSAITGGTDPECADNKVPAAVIPHLPGC